MFLYKLANPRVSKCVKNHAGCRDIVRRVGYSIVVFNIAIARNFHTLKSKPIKASGVSRALEV